MNDPDNVVDPVVLAERRARRAEMAEEELRELLRETELGAATLRGRLAAVEAELASARTQRDALAVDLVRHEKELRAASQREQTEQALRSEAQTRAAEATTGSRREVDELRVRLIAAEQRAALLTQVEAEVAERLARAIAAEDELAALRGEVASRQAEIAGLRRELERYGDEALRAPAGSEPVDPALAARIAAERTAFAAQVSAVEHAIAGLRPQLAAAASALAERMDAEHRAREEAERALQAEREKVAELEAGLAAVASREAAVIAVVAELGASVAALRGRFADELEVRVAELTGVADALRAELGREQAWRSAAQAELERLQAEQAQRAGERADLEREQARVVAALTELEQEHARHTATMAQLERLRDEHAELTREHAARSEERAKLEREQDRLAAAQSELVREQAQHTAAQAALAREQALRTATESVLARERAHLEAVIAELEALRAQQPPAIDINELARAADRLRAQVEPRQEPEPAAEPEVAPRPASSEEDRRDELARVLAAQQAAAAAARDAEPDAHLPVLEIPVVVPAGDGDGAWLREGIRRVGRADPGLAAQLLLALVPVQAHAARRKLAYELTIGEVGTWRVELDDMAANIEPGGSDAATAFRLSGSPGDLAALVAGGGRRKLTARVEGSRLAVWRLARARRKAPTLAQAAAAGGHLPLRGVLALLAAVAPDGGRCSVAFDGGEPITAAGTRGGAVILRTGSEQAGATLRAPAEDLVALLIGLAPAGPIRVSGDVAQATTLVTRLHRAQGLR